MAVCQNSPFHTVSYLQLSLQAAPLRTEPKQGIYAVFR